MNAKAGLVAVVIATAACASLTWGQDTSSRSPSSAAATSTSPPGTPTPVRQAEASPPAAAAVPERDQTSSPSPSQTTPASADTGADNASRSATELRDEAEAPPRRLAEGDEVTTGTMDNGRECIRLRGLEKAECERRDNPRDDLPAGVTSTQKPK